MGPGGIGQARAAMVTDDFTGQSIECRISSSTMIHPDFIRMHRSRNGSDVPGDAITSGVTDIDRHAMSSCERSLIFRICACCSRPSLAHSFPNIDVRVARAPQAKGRPHTADALAHWHVGRGAGPGFRAIRRPSYPRAPSCLNRAGSRRRSGAVSSPRAPRARGRPAGRRRPASHRRS